MREPTDKLITIHAVTMKHVQLVSSHATWPKRAVPAFAQSVHHARTDCYSWVEPRASFADLSFCGINGRKVRASLSDQRKLRKLAAASFVDLVSDGTCCAARATSLHVAQHIIEGTLLRQAYC